MLTIRPPHLPPYRKGSSVTHLTGSVILQISLNKHLSINGYLLQALVNTGKVSSIYGIIAL